MGNYGIFHFTGNSGFISSTVFTGSMRVLRAFLGFESRGVSESMFGDLGGLGV